MTTAIILAGGSGTRLMPLTATLNKSLIPIDGVPAIVHQIRSLQAVSITQVLVLTGYLNDQVARVIDFFFESNPRISCVYSPEEFSPGLRLIDAEKYIVGEKILICYCDNILDKDSIESIFRKPRETSIIVNPRISGNARIRSDGTVQYSPGKDKSFQFVELGYLHIEKTSFFSILRRERNLEKTIERISNTTDIYPFIVENYKSISNLEKYCDLRKSRNLLFLDRDGVINENPGKGLYVSKPNQLRYIKRNIRLFRDISREYDVDFIVVSNQAGIERKIVSEENVLEVNRQIALDMLLNSVPVLAFYVCPHHWDSACACRKPKPGLLHNAERDFMWRIKPSFLIGDSDSDLGAAANYQIDGLLLTEKMNEKEFKEIAKEINTKLSSERVFDGIHD
jgi:D-glycero-D-manno-heptose 1,7-bisphosphate phosphatase